MEDVNDVVAEIVDLVSMSCNAPSQTSETGQFANLPTDVLLEIFRRLPLECKIMLGRTNTRLHDLSTVAISETDCINFADYQLRKISAKAVEKLLERCAKNLKRILFPKEFKPVVDEEIEEVTRFIRVIAAFSYPQLEELSFPAVRIGNDMFAKIIQKFPNLRRFEWKRCEEYPWENALVVCPEAISKKLSTVMLGKCDGRFIRSLAERCPNLTHFQFGIRYPAYPAALADLDMAFVHCRKVTKLNIDCPIDSLNHFWTIPSLRSLKFKNYAGDSVAVKISEHFRSLENLELRYADRLTGFGYANLATLPDLRRLNIRHFFINRYDDEPGIRRLAKAGRLEEVSLIGITKLTPATFLSFVHSCVNLRRLSVRTPKGVESAAAAIEVIRGMIGRKRDLEIEFYDTNKFTPWTAAEEVTAELNEVNRRNGCTIRVTRKEFIGRFHWYD